MSNVRNQPQQSHKIGFNNKTIQAIKNAASGKYNDRNDDDDDDDFDSLNEDFFPRRDNNGLLYHARTPHIAGYYC